MLLVYLLIQQRVHQHGKVQGKSQAFLSNHQGKLPPRPPNRGIDNRPAWMYHSRDDKKVKDITCIDPPSDRQRKKGRLWTYSANIFISNTTSTTPPMSLDVDNGLPGIALWFGLSPANEISFICHMDTCKAMNTGNLTVHKWLMRKTPLSFRVPTI